MKELMKKAAQGVFSFGDRFGVHVMPSSYYTSIPSRKWLKANEPLWQMRSPLPGVAWNLDAQAEWLRETAGTYPAELPLGPMIERAQAVGGFRYGPIEAQMLYSVVRRYAPPRIVELGAGSSTMILSEAVARNVSEGGTASAIDSFDPYTAHHVKGLPHVTSHARGALELGLEDLAVQAGDLLFIDTTHVVRTGSEVPHLYVNLLPALPVGVLIHIHDIYLPYLYSPAIYETMFDWQETTLVAALLSGNDHFEVLAGMAALHDQRTDVLVDVFPEYRPRVHRDGIRSTGDRRHYPSSLWLRTV